MCFCLHEAFAISPKSDSRVDFFTEPVTNIKKRHSYVEITMKQVVAPLPDTSPNTCSSISNVGNSTGINVTSNPMDETTASATCTTQTPRATIVVQQVIKKTYTLEAATEIIVILLNHFN